MAKIVNDVLLHRRSAFWRDTDHKDYFDGCVRDVLQFRRAYGYILTQSVRHGICRQWENYPHTRVRVGLEPALQRAVQIKAFMEGFPYTRYELAKRR